MSGIEGNGVSASFRENVPVQVRMIFESALELMSCTKACSCAPLLTKTPQDQNQIRGQDLNIGGLSLMVSEGPDSPHEGCFVCK